MNRDQFWHTIEDGRRGAGDNADRVAASLVSLLQQRPVNDIVSFGSHCDAVMVESRSQVLWAAAYLINGGCSEDGFDYFRGWLLTRGHAVWSRAVAEPDTLVEVVGTSRVARLVRSLRPLECEEMLSVAYDACQRATGDSTAYWEAAAELGGNLLKPESRDEEWFNFDDPFQMRARLPRLAARLL